MSPPIKKQNYLMNKFGLPKNPKALRENRKYGKDLMKPGQAGTKFDPLLISSLESLPENESFRLPWDHKTPRESRGYDPMGLMTPVTGQAGAKLDPLCISSLESEATKQAKSALSQLDSVGTPPSPRHTIHAPLDPFVRLVAGMHSTSFSPKDEVYSPRQSSMANLMEEIEQMGKLWELTPKNEMQCILADECDTPELSDDSSDGLPKHTKICKHYLRGFCKLGDRCNFLHDVSVFKPDEQKVFLGGLPRGITCDNLIYEMKTQGYTVVNRPRIHDRGFTPKVCIDSVAHARTLVKKGYVTIEGKKVDVRPYQDKKGNLPEKRAVFIGGLPIGTTGLALSRELFERGFIVKRTPVIRDGYAPRVDLQTVDQANALIVLGRLAVFGKTVDIRPWVPVPPRRPIVARANTYTRGPPRKLSPNAQSFRYRNGPKVTVVRSRNPIDPLNCPTLRESFSIGQVGGVW